MTAFVDAKPAARSNGSARRAIASAVAPALFTLFYPAFVDGFHWAVGMPGTRQTLGSVILAGAMLLLMFAVPLYGFLRIARGPASPAVSRAFETRARRLAYATVTAPTLYCFVGVWQFLLSSPLPDELVWCLIWGSAMAYTALVPTVRQIRPSSTPSDIMRVMHGITALILVVYVAFHLTNHLFAWQGAAAHAAVMDAGRKIYRAPFIEPILIIAMLFQVVTGLMLAWRWSAQRLDFHKRFQVASGIFLSVYILGHLNAVFTFARWFYGIPTGWDFATGAPNGLIHDPWSVRLIPHYALATFLIIGHVFSGLRVVLLAHDMKVSTANRMWEAGVALAAIISVSIMLAMCGLRL